MVLFFSSPPPPSVIIMSRAKRTKAKKATESTQGFIINVNKTDMAEEVRRDTQRGLTCKHTRAHHRTRSQSTDRAAVRRIRSLPFDIIHQRHSSFELSLRLDGAASIWRIVRWNVLATSTVDANAAETTDEIQQRHSHWPLVSNASSGPL